MKVDLFIIYICCFLLWHLEALAHGGGLNKEGCHNNRKTGDYHCHREKKSSIDEVSSKKQEFIVCSASVTDGIPFVLEKYGSGSTALMLQKVVKNAK